jgi:ribA/ribD-fused uncharacterized protein
MEDLRTEVLKNYDLNLPNKVMGFFKEHRPLSNFHLEPFEWSGMTWPSSENAYQAAKAPGSEWLKFAKMNPGDSRKAGQLVKMDKVDWDSRKYDVMKSVLVEKFNQCPIARKVLIDTKDAYLEEVTWWSDSYWGTYKGFGRSKLGEILMDIRKTLNG